MDAIHARMQSLAPAVGRLLQNPNMLQELAQQDPNLQALMASNPAMAEVLRPEKLQQMLEVLQDPSKLATQPILPGGDLSQHRMVGTWGMHAPKMYNSARRQPLAAPHGVLHMGHTAPWAHGACSTMRAWGMHNLAWQRTAWRRHFTHAGCGGGRRAPGACWEDTELGLVWHAAPCMHTKCAIQLSGTCRSTAHP